MKTMTESEFAAADDTINTRLRGTKYGTPERATVVAQLTEWEAALSLPQATWQQRATRLEAIAATAALLGLVSR